MRRRPCSIRPIWMEVISVVCPSRGIDGAFENYHAKFADRWLSDIRSGRQCDRPDGRFRMRLNHTDIRQLTPGQLSADNADLSPSESPDHRTGGLRNI